MLKKIAIIISPNYKDYARKYLAECVDSIRKQDYAGEMKIFIADNETSEESLALLNNIVQTHGHASVQIIRNEKNDGFAKGNNDAIKKALEQEFEYVILFNMDTVLEPDCVRKMVEAVEDNKILDSRLRGNDKEKSGNDKKEIGAVQARIMLYSENLTLVRLSSPKSASPYKAEGTINSLGNVTHFLGFGYAQGYGETFTPDPSPAHTSQERDGKARQISFSHEERNRGRIRHGGEICYPSGAAVLFKREVLEKVGLFDEEFWMYNEDQDLGWRIWLAGYKCVLAPEAVVYHKYEFSRSIKKYYWLDRNRIIAMLKNYHWLTLLLIAPAFLAMEIGLLFFSLSNGWFKEKINVYKYFLKFKNWQHIMSERKKIQSARVSPDKDIIKLFSGRIWYQEVGDGRLKIANVIFNIYWKIIKVLIRW